MMYKVMVFLLLLSSFKTIKAQTADLELIMDFAGINEGGITVQQREFTITVTNHGPDAANLTNDYFFVTSTLVNSNEQWIPDIFFELDTKSSSPECNLSVFFIDPLPGSTPNYAFAFFFGELNPNESITCMGTYTLFFAEGERTVSWNLTNPFASDPNLSNNEVSVTFGLRPVSVPINSKWSWVLLALMLLLITSFRLRKVY